LRNLIFSSIVLRRGVGNTYFSSMRQRLLNCFFVVLLIFSVSEALSSCASNARHNLAVEYYNLGNAYYKIKDYDKAIDFFNKSIEQDPSLLHAHYNLSLALIQQGRGAEANEILQSLLEKDPDNTAVLQIIGYSLYVQGKGEEALDVFDKILELKSNDLNALYNRGIVLWDLNRKREAEKSFRELLGSISQENEELYPDTLFNLGKLLIEMGDYGEALGYLEEYLEWEDKDVEGYKLLAQAYRAHESYGKALETYNQILTLDSEQPEVWMDKAEILLTKIEDPLSGLEALDQAIILGFDDKKRFEALLNDPGLVEIEAVKDVLEQWGLLP
jgi:tetratricopeptide (TPR) repeat protein